MVRSVGFRLGDVRRPADRQSMNSVESWFAQNSRSSSSDGNSGTGFSFIFVFGIGILFSSIHVPNGDYAHQRTADGEGHEQASPAVGLPKRNATKVSSSRSVIAVKRCADPMIRVYPGSTCRGGRPVAAAAPSLQ